MRVLVVCGAGYVYGKEFVTLSLMKGLRDRGHEVRCLTTTWGDGNFPKLLEKIAIPYTKLPLGFISKTLSWSAVWMTLDQIRKIPLLWLGYWKTIKTFKPDIVVHSNFQHIFLLWPLLGGKINVFHVHDFFSPTKFYRCILRILELRLYLFVGVSKFIAESLVSLGIPKQKVKYILNGIPLEGDQVTARSYDVVPADNPSLGNPISIGIVGQVGKWKGHDDLIEALRLLKEKGSPFVCKIFGNGDLAYAGVLQKKIENYDLANRVRWMGFVDKGEAIYPTIDVCVTPSRAFEAFGMVAAEASFYGIPTVASRNGGLREVVQDNYTGYLVDAGSPEQLADKLQLLIRSPEMRRNMGSAARSFAVKNLTSKRMVEEMEKLFEKVIASKASVTAESI